jgi:hypothetical protein
LIEIIFNLYGLSEQLETTMNNTEEQKTKEFNAVKQWVRDSLFVGNYDDWEWDEDDRVLTIYCKDTVESDKGLVKQYLWEELAELGLKTN